MKRAIVLVLIAASVLAISQASQQPVTQVEFEVVSSTAGEGDVSHAVALLLVAPAGVPLGYPITATVVDQLTGSATAGSDYSFASQTVTFAAGSLNGDTQNVFVTLIDDVLVEGDELLNLAISAVSGPGASIGLQSTHSVTLVDDDVVVDDDGDGVNNDDDLCPGTTTGDSVDADGCSDNQLDIDNDGVLGADDNCANTMIPESLPTRSLGVNRFALMDGDGLFDTTPPKGKGPRRSYTIADTTGCSCTQIIDGLGLGNGHTKFGCSISAMDAWVLLVNP